MSVTELVKKSLALGAGVLLLAVLFVSGCRQSGGAPPAPATPDMPVVKAVYLFHSEACQCESNRNAAAEEAMANVAASDPAARRPEKIDVSRQPAELERYQKLTPFGFMPVLLGLDANGRVVRKVEGFFKEDEVLDVLAVPPARGR